MSLAEGRLRAIAVFVATLGIAVATYIAVAEADGGAPACFAGGGGCEAVAESSHSELAGINVAVLGILGYLLLLGAALLRGDGARLVGFALALVGFGYSVYLTWLELFVIDAICQWCVASAILMTVLFAVNAVRMLRYVGTPR
ncbi:MAG TPA: vitamin K epoxide reductase family protein [Solirubrobacterales bacterium]|nr:vitamin K epoxide reductase family protein [Solirubrobacterales bacterium]